jgi:hypothetical protein
MMVISAQSALASPIWSWSFDETEYFVQRGDSLVLHATLRSDPSSLDELPITGISAMFTGDLQKAFRFTFGPTLDSREFGLELLGVTLTAGAEIPFVYGILRPRRGAAPGTYAADPATLGLAFEGVPLEQRFSTSTFRVTASVPEPPLVVLVGIGVVGAIRAGMIGRHRRSRVPRRTHRRSGGPQRPSTGPLLAMRKGSEPGEVQRLQQLLPGDPGTSQPIAKLGHPALERAGLCRRRQVTPTDPVLRGNKAASLSSR